MNLNTLNISVTPCVVCDYAFSDKHHIWPQAKGGKSLPTMLLCPNHHRFANLVQAMLLRGLQRSIIEAFARKYFDAAFNITTLMVLITEQERLSDHGWRAYFAQKEQEARGDPQLALSAAESFISQQYARLMLMAPSEQLPMADFQEAMAHRGAVKGTMESYANLNAAMITEHRTGQAPVSQAEYKKLLAEINALLAIAQARHLLDLLEAGNRTGARHTYALLGRTLGIEKEA